MFWIGCIFIGVILYGIFGIWSLLFVPILIVVGLYFVIVDERAFIKRVEDMSDGEYDSFIKNLNRQINSPLGDKTALCEKRDMAEHHRNKPAVDLWAIFWWSCFATAAMCGFVLLAQNM